MQGETAERILKVAEALMIEADALRLGPGDDYELILAVHPEREGAVMEAARETGTPLAFVGTFTSQRDRVWIGQGKAHSFAEGGWNHFGSLARR